MDKFGVEQDNGLKKTAEENQDRCPVCGCPIPDSDETGGIFVCPKCGTKPFEKTE